MSKYRIPAWSTATVCGAGVYLASLIPGLVSYIGNVVVALVTGGNGEHVKILLGGTPGLMVIGAGLAALIGWLTRERILTAMEHRVRKFALFGAVTLPIWAAIGQIPEGGAAASIAVSIPLCAGVIAGIVYVARTRRRVKAHLARNAHTPAAR
ncbi:hypothetical protein [Amycolatopsis anabasis]|uniref:hypothetical protein n=1 Tax=Amycolatopsis anabasis TaxID=1840409 RepID=UPI00131C8C32|nr:hypothetical protein [Amycolatopsis anabasis]